MTSDNEPQPAYFNPILAECYKKNYDRNLLWAKIRYGNRAEDVLHDAVVSLARRRDIRPDKPNGLLRTAAVRRAINSSEKNDTRLSTTTEAYDRVTANSPSTDPESDTETAVINKLSYESLVKKLKALPGGEKATGILIANVVEGYTYRELSEQTGHPITSLKSSASRHAERFRALYDLGDFLEGTD